MHFIKQKSQQDNGLAALENLLLLLKIKFSPLSVSKVKRYHDYPSFSSLSYFLDSFQIDNLGVSLRAEDLMEIPYPAILHLKQNDGHFVVLENLKNGCIRYIDPELGWIEEPLENFDKKWTGTALLISRTEQSSDPNYTLNKKLKLTHRIKRGTAYAVLGGVVLATLYQALDNAIQLTWYLLLSLKLLGLFLTGLIISTSRSATKSWYNSICSLATNINCRKVVNSTAGKLLGTRMTVWGFLYFFSGLLVLLVSAFGLEGISIPLVGMTVAALPYSLFSIYYQWRRVRSWCPLCLAVMATFWLELFVQWNLFSKVPDISHLELGISAAIFGLPFAFWFLFEEKVEESQKVPLLERSLDYFKKDKSLFFVGLASQQTVEPPNFSRYVTLGSFYAPNTLLVVTNPNCPACESAHKVIERVVEKSAEQWKAVFIFAGTNGGNAERVAKLIIELSLQDKSVLASQALNRWFSKKNKTTLKGWIEEYPLVGTGAADETLRLHNEWCKKVGVDSTPTIFINEKRLMPEYDVADLECLLKS